MQKNIFNFRHFKSLLILFAGLLIVTSACGSDSEETSTDGTAEKLPFAEIEEPKVIRDANLAPEEKFTGTPVTTVKVNVNDTSIYTGYLGTITRTEKIADAVARPPKATEGTYPLTGLGGNPPDRPAAIVKIDNGFGSDPQTGIERADIVFEEPIEVGSTRLAAVFHSQTSTVGPVRSARTTDLSFINAFNKPMYVYSGANIPTDSLIRKQNVLNHSYDTTSGFWREKTHRPPSTLFTELSRHWAAEKGGTPAAQFVYRSADESAEGTKAETINVNYEDNKVEWEWDGSKYLRSQKGKKHISSEDVQLSAENVVVVETVKKTTGMTDELGAPVYENIFVGTNKAVVFTDGKKITGVWTRPTLEDVATLTKSDGEVIQLTAGQTWVEIISEGANELKE